MDMTVEEQERMERLKHLTKQERRVILTILEDMEENGDVTDILYDTTPDENVYDTFHSIIRCMNVINHGKAVLP